MRQLRARLGLGWLLIVLVVSLASAVPVSATCYQQYQASLEDCGYSYHGLPLVMCAGESAAAYVGCLRRLV